jgi:hypothetical protein
LLLRLDEECPEGPRDDENGDEKCELDGRELEDERELEDDREDDE